MATLTKKEHAPLNDFIFLKYHHGNIAIGAELPGSIVIHFNIHERC